MVPFTSGRSLATDTEILSIRIKLSARIMGWPLSPLGEEAVVYVIFADFANHLTRENTHPITCIISISYTTFAKLLF
ncbi:MAG: hypothetical protein EB078_11860 [Proteobacteria bacterium]|nr:hypothetical protein [Pseudomonadota bacterium]NDC25818.1 hypothetical protein [Pseudomonadota bacterium]NDD05594.1 hypothetical protein [Pseudomonadota bacterium]NDG25595.1 hypothetical protein [Pseudomonadota bacterium]